MLLRNQKQLSDTFQSRSSSPDPSYSSTLTCASYTMLSSTTSSQEDQKEDLPLQQNSATECASMADTIGSLVQNQLRLFLNKQETTINNQLAHVETALHEQQKQIDRLTASFQSSIPSILSMDKSASNTESPSLFAFSNEQTQGLIRKMLVQQVEDLKNFVGGTHNIDEWLNKLESIGNKAGANDKELFLLGSAKLGGEAEQVFGLTGKDINSWTGFKNKLRELFGSSNQLSKIMVGKQLHNRLQSPNETPVQYLLAVNDLCSRFQVNMVDAERVDYLINGVRPELRSFILRDNPRTPEEFLVAIQKAQRRVEIDQAEGSTTRNDGRIAECNDRWGEQSRGSLGGGQNRYWEQQQTSNQQYGAGYQHRTGQDRRRDQGQQRPTTFSQAHHLN